MNNTVQSALAFRDAGRVQAALIRPDSTVFVARVDVTDGEQRVRVNFPVEYTDKPFVTYGGENRLGSVIVPSSAPILSSHVIQWLTVQRGVEPHYVGADVMCVVVGPSGTRMSMDLWFTGNALGGAR